MKRLFSSIALIALTFAGVHAADALNYFALTGTKIGATNSHAIVSANGVAPFAKIQYLNVTSDLSTSRVQLYRVGDGVLVHSDAAAGGTNIPAPGTGNFTASTPIILRGVGSDTYERLFVDSVSATNVVSTANTVNAITAGDIVYPLTPAGFIPVGNATKEINAAGSALVVGQKNKPIYVEITGTSACQVNVISGSYSD